MHVALSRTFLFRNHYVRRWHNGTNCVALSSCMSRFARRIIGQGCTHSVRVTSSWETRERGREFDSVRSIEFRGSC
ncbi:hypothetical protein EXIGLDRAFT_149406 [Exidia glandulosa HHB12029]|uniref:Uncharacterized protein n=1 Tax=Exidia glandulosa HHB12029 TaxID=1314781 RepID=A0A165FM52_EXIGL|nr:hypothetical protein EXIGLDRAFT_149406 [Exidia glandulosa HHB12029]